jgi:uncharacterized protein involved in exopolysaccharide biosynthesis
MTNQPIRFDLIELIKVGLRWKKFIIGFAFIAAIAMAIYALTLKNIYKSYTVYFPSSALIGSRDNLFRTEIQDGIDQVGLENEVDRAIVVANSAPVLSELIEKFKMAKHYKIDVINDPKGHQKTYKKFAKNYSVTKGARGQIEMTFSDWEPQLSADILNAALVSIQDKYRFFYSNSGKGISEALDKQSKNIDSTIVRLTDSLVTMREKYGIYEIISPGRKVETQVKSTNARGIEEIQNLEELKDQYVRDRAKFASVTNEHITVMHKSIPFLQVVQYPTPGGEKVGPFRTIMVAGTFIAAFFIGLIIAFCAEYFPSILRQLKD